MSATVTQLDEYKARLTRVRHYARSLRGAEQKADQSSLDIAADLAWLYEQKAWVDDLEPPKNKVWRGRPVDPESRNRFAKWALTVEGIAPRTTYTLLKAHELRTNYLHSVQTIPSGEGSLRPLYALQRRGYGDRTPEVYDRAVELAGGQTPTREHTKQAVSEFWQQFTRPQIRQLDQTAQARTHATKARAEMQWLADHGYLRDLADLLTEMDRLGETLAKSQNDPAS